MTQIDKDKLNGNNEQLYDTAKHEKARFSDL